MKSTPRRMEAAAKPARSPTTPPPRATTASVRVRPKAIMSSHSSMSCPAFLEASPAGTAFTFTWNPAPVRLSATRSPYRGATLESVITYSRTALGRRALHRSPARESRPRSISMSYSRPGRATVKTFLLIPRPPSPCRSGPPPGGCTAGLRCPAPGRFCTPANGRSSRPAPGAGSPGSPETGRSTCAR